MCLSIYLSVYLYKYINTYTYMQKKMRYAYRNIYRILVYSRWWCTVLKWSMLSAYRWFIYFYIVSCVVWCCSCRVFVCVTCFSYRKQSLYTSIYIYEDYVLTCISTRDVRGQGGLCRRRFGNINIWIYYILYLCVSMYVMVCLSVCLSISIYLYTYIQREDISM